MSVIEQRLAYQRKRVYGLDGDKIGASIEALFIQNNLEEIREFSQKVTEAIEEIKRQIRGRQGDIIFCSGDSILFLGDFDEEWCEQILQRFAELTGCTASMGVGESLQDAYLGLKLAKASGGGLLMYYHR
ncbi:mCpol domain-containing protein [Thermogemmatispora onikobensis]|uniref:mCpol domain-containing protein n=1 Tax=Thermogemmatispora onikobensis TaxID=732234 RepID=UPI00159F2129|nr:mCpol domain-containing protein [Thermogemmatispora onikobensis]